MNRSAQNLQCSALTSSRLIDLCVCILPRAYASVSVPWGSKHQCRAICWVSVSIIPSLKLGLCSGTFSPALTLSAPPVPASGRQGESRTPIKQDIKKGQLRFYPYPISWNYGMLPQTWEDPAIVHEEVGAAGDNDPVGVPQPRPDFYEQRCMASKSSFYCRQCGRGGGGLQGVAKILHATAQHGPSQRIVTASSGWPRRAVCDGRRAARQVMQLQARC